MTPESTASAAEKSGACRHVAVCVCTAGRPRMLRDCLDSLRHQRTPAGWTYSIIVIDNNATPEHNSIITLYQTEKSGADFYYVHEARQGIPFARNRALREALAINAEWIAFIDDDETAEKDWLAALITGAIEFNAAVVTGDVRQIYPPDSAYPPPRTWDESGSPRGHLRSYAWTNNVMLHRSLIDGRQHSMRFNENMTHTGGTDQEFFGRARQAGIEIRQIPEAIVTEYVPASRARLPYYLYRQLSTRSIAARLKRQRLGNWVAVPKLLFRTLRYLVRGTWQLLRLLLLALFVSPAKRRQYLTDCLIEFASAGGMLLGMTSLQIQRYSTIHGD